jgi:hypothetical protein
MNGDTENRPDEGLPGPRKLASFRQAFFLFIYHVVLGLFLAYAIYNVWPPQPWPKEPAAQRAAAKKAKNPGTTDSTGTTDTAGRSAAPSTSEAAEAELSSYGGEFPPPFWLFGWKFMPPLETRLILLVLLAGAVGSYVHATASFVDYLGNRTFISSWGWWYLLRPFIGMMLALLFYFVFRGGFVTAGINQGGDAAASFINPFGVAALAGLVGMFSKVAADKLNEVFLTLFKPDAGHGDAKRGDKLATDAMLTISAINPNTGPAAGGTSVTINGTALAAGTQVTLGGVAATRVTVGSDTSLTAVTPAHAAGAVDVAVTSPDKQSAVLKDGFTYQ